ncbi:MAG: hypothetical protein JXA77_07075 [Bacteroidales bacterium]|nr:hypothetical protein [Bacteroidales bacterium]MBN2819637.1 hypothetical protein [Bacteroidales bacterium]
MENNNNQQIVILRDKIKQIISLFESEKDKRKALDAENTKAKEEIKKLKEEKEKLTIQYNNLKLAKSIEEAVTSPHDAKLKINRIVREIDKCIALLNK